MAQGVPRLGQRQTHCDHILRIEAEVDIEQFYEAADHESGSREQHKREGDFGDYQETTRARLMTAPQRFPAASFQSIADISSSRLECRN